MISSEDWSAGPKQRQGIREAERVDGNVALPKEPKTLYRAGDQRMSLESQFRTQADDDFV
jgi:hypothetical protein